MIRDKHANQALATRGNQANIDIALVQNFKSPRVAGLGLRGLAYC
jgi:hypothetical protein